MNKPEKHKKITETHEIRLRSEELGPDPNSRRAFLTGAAGLAISSAAGQTLTSSVRAEANQTDDNRTLDRLDRVRGESAPRILLKGATVITMDPELGNFSQADIMIEGKKIAAVSPSLSVAARDGKAIVVNAKDSILIPGFVDPHIHSWEGQLSGIIPNANGVATDARHDYTTVMHQLFALYYRPEDMYIGNLMTALSCLEAGITCFCDNSHNTRSSAHADAAINGLTDSGARAVFACGPARFGEWDHQWPKDLYRIKRQFFSSSDQLVTLRLMAVPPPTPGPDHFRVARDLDLWISFDGGGNNPMLPSYYRDGLLVGHECFNHGGGIPEPNWQVIRDYGAKVNVCPRSDSQFRYGGNGIAMNSIQDVLDHGLRPGISNDNASAYAIDMFDEMHTLYFSQRSTAQQSRLNGNPHPPVAITKRDVLEFATLRGAECCGLGTVCGSLTPGKQADIVMIRTDNIHLSSLNNAFGTVVQAANIGDIDAVFVAGQLKKWRGQTTSKLFGHDLDKIRKMAEESRSHLIAAARWPLDIFSD